MVSFRARLLAFSLAILPFAQLADLRAETLPGTEPLTLEGDLAAKMVEGIHTYLKRESDNSIEHRNQYWNRDPSSHEKYIQSVEPNRKRLSKILGVVDQRKPVSMELVATTAMPALVGRGTGYEVYTVRWPVLDGVDGEGLLLVPNGEPLADVVALPDCDWTPEMLVGLSEGVPEEAQFARRLAENGCRVVVPALIDRNDTHSGNPKVRMTNQPHREFLYRPAYEMGRHIIGYEVQKILAAVDWFEGEGQEEKPVGAIGYGEGGLLALYAAALDPRIDAAAVSGYFGPREDVWKEPIYRNVWSLLQEFGDAEIASLIVPRTLLVEACDHPQVEGPPPPREGRSGAAPGVLRTPRYEDVQREISRAQDLVKGLDPPAKIRLTGTGKGSPGSEELLRVFLESMGGGQLQESGDPPDFLVRNDERPERRLKRLFDQILEHTQRLMRESEFVRRDFWSKADDSNLESWAESSKWYRDYLSNEVIGPLPPPSLPPRPRTRLVYDEPKFEGYEVLLDVFPDVVAYGILLVPKGIGEEEKRPVVVCQHGLEGRPQDVANPQEDNRYYHQFACKLAQRGFVTYAPQNPYIGGDSFRVLQRLANPLKKSLFSFIVRQHEQTLEWLAGLPFVDPERIAFYGLSYGGKTAMRVPALLEQYCLSICSADYNEWIWKNVSFRHPFSYLFTGEYEMPEFDLGNTFNYAELSWLICPRPFMVERGHFDGVSEDEWVAYEYARTLRRYDLLGIGDRTRIEVFTGPHTIHGVGTFEFLHEQLGWDGG